MRKIVVSGMIGNALEWYEYALYTQFASVISRVFFPAGSEIKEFLTFAIFAAGFLVRPLGGVIFGYIGDKFGRKFALILGIFTMAIPTTLIGLLPSYTEIGVLAPIILGVLRVIQGFSLGGEFSGCITYMVEHAPPQRRGLVGSASFVSMCIGILFGSIIAWAISSILSENDLINWGWRIPFITGIFIGLIGMYIRVHLSESPIYILAKQQGKLSKAPLRETLYKYWPELLVSIGIYLTVTGPFYTLVVYMNYFLTQVLKYPVNEVSVICVVGLITLIITIPISAHISDNIGRKPVLIITTMLLVSTVYLIFWLFGQKNFYTAILAQILFSTILGGYMGPMPTTLVEIFPTRIRLTGVAISYNISAAVFGGTAPMIGIALVKATSNEYAVSFYLIILGMITLCSLKYFSETYRKQLLHP